MHYMSSSEFELTFHTCPCIEKRHVSPIFLVIASMNQPVPEDPEVCSATWYSPGVSHVVFHLRLTGNLLGMVCAFQAEVERFRFPGLAGSS